MPAYYNEVDPFAAEWLRQLISAGHIAPGDVDTRSIVDVQPDDLRGFTQCHFFAGIGVWSYALRLAGWPDDRSVWTGSCPCQPFSAAGKGGGFADERHLWPAWHHLISQCRPDVVLGEQVASKDGLAWFDLVSADMEGADYAGGAVDLCAAGFGAPHIRQRLFVVWLADAGNERRDRQHALLREERGGRGARHLSEVARRGEDGGLEHAELPARPRQRPFGGPAVCQQDAARPTRTSMADRLDGYARNAGLLREQAVGPPASRPGPTNGFWRAADWLYCRDDRWRPVEPGTFPLAHGVAARVGRLRGYGNAINAETAAAFISAISEVIQEAA